MASGDGVLSFSANEVMALAGKAARGAGAPPAQAAQFGRAAVAHLLAGRDPEMLKAALASLPQGPILSVPRSLDRIAEGGESGLSMDTALVRSYLETLPHAAWIDAAGRVVVDLAAPNRLRLAGRIDLDRDTVAQWSALAARILVPETEASRRAGAGAGLTDND
ncbi:hypothetical protein ABMC89_07300 [Sulfitobacter sp. HNIBRBA3233]|uniref:hypothetical protein n=1 Tax=Sulfitobacter marinivivus TaxID=3158558 RepID=UPI0032DE6ACE